MISKENIKSATATSTDVPVKGQTVNGNAANYYFSSIRQTLRDANAALEGIRSKLPPLPEGMQDYPSVDPVRDENGHIIGYRPCLLRQNNLQLEHA